MKTLAVLLASTALVAGANAAEVMFSFGTPTLGFQTTEINQVGSLGLFDSNLGTLTGVSLMFSGANTTTITLTNRAAGAENISATGITNLFFGSNLGALNAVITANNPVIPLSNPTGLQSIASGATMSFGPIAQSGSVTWTALAGDKLAGLLPSFSQAGGGNFNLSCFSLSGITILGGGGNVGSTQSTQAGCGGKIIYTFGAAPPPTVPEPASLALVGLALVGLSLARRKAKKA